MSKTVADVASIVLDPSIRDWVLIPIFTIMILQGILRQYLSTIMAVQKEPEKVALIHSSSLQRSQRFRHNARWIPMSAYRMRKAYFLEKVFKVDDEKKEEANPLANNPMQDPFMMVNMMKQNMLMIVPNMLLMGWVSYFFPGFVLLRLPFGMSEGFRDMLQRGIDLRSLDVSYVSSLSWYFLCFFGLRGVFTLLLGSSAASDEHKLLEQQMKGGAGGGMGQPVDTNKLNQQERTELEILEHEGAVSWAEQQLLD